MNNWDVIKPIDARLKVWLLCDGCDMKQLIGNFPYFVLRPNKNAFFKLLVPVDHACFGRQYVEFEVIE